MASLWTTSLLASRVLLVAIALSFAVPRLSGAGWEEGRAAFARKDYASAIREWLPLAREGHAESQLNLAFLYNQGLGVPVDHVKAAMWYLKAAEQGLAEAQAALATLYIHGLGVPQDYAEAYKWAQLAAVQGHPHGQFNLGAMYVSGFGVQRDYTKAASWFRKAAEQGDAAGQVNLGLLYAQGVGVPRDDVEALKWVLLAPRQTIDPAVGAPDIVALTREMDELLRKRMSPAQIAEAEKRAREWNAQGK